MKNNLTMLMILDGYGVNANEKGNAVALANKPNIDKIFSKYPNSLISTSGMDVGLPEGQMGNSEVGHTNIGAGRIVYQELTRITKSIKDGDFFKKPELIGAIEHCKKSNSKLHIYGLISDGGVHSQVEHLYALLELCKQQDFNKVYIHAFLDGRDTPPTSAEKYLEDLEKKMTELGVGKIATIMGRFYAMDRDNRWERVQEAYRAMVLGEGVKHSSSLAAIENAYQSEQFDEFVKPVIICEKDEPIATISENDSIIMFNYRTDRAREITRTFVDPEFKGFDREYFKVHYVCFTQYDESMPNVEVAFKPQSLSNTLGEYISNKGLKQLRIAETEKYAHVTFFFNGGEEKVYAGEERILINSPKVATYDMQPEMSAYEVKEKVVEAIKQEKFDTIILNFANCDMVGHTGNLEAAIKAVEAIDKCVGEIYEEILKVNGKLLITADHGNAEQMIDYVTGDMFTAHTTNLVPLVLVGEENVKLKNGRLCDLAPTMLELMNLEKPSEMTGVSLIER